MSEASHRELPANPNLTHLRNQARDLQRAARGGELEAIERIRSSHPAPPQSFADLSLRDAQLTLAREYGFDGWHALQTEAGERMVSERDLHRWFGVQLNNGTWDLIDAADTGPHSPVEDREHFLYSAYASAFHWRNVGGAANSARGEHLISRAACAIGRFDLALHHARRCLEIIEANRDATEDWDRAFGLEALARAQAGAGDPQAPATRAEAEAATAAIADEADREIVEAELARPPWFGLES
jgi:hypothetical protein